jgi:hypothetical protein
MQAMNTTFSSFSLPTGMAYGDPTLAYGEFPWARGRSMSSARGRVTLTREMIRSFAKKFITDNPAERARLDELRCQSRSSSKRDAASRSRWRTEWCGLSKNPRPRVARAKRDEAKRARGFRSPIPRARMLAERRSCTALARRPLSYVRTRRAHAREARGRLDRAPMLPARRS